MTKEEIKKRVDDCMKSFFDEFKNAPKKQAEEAVLICQIASFYGDILTEADLDECANYLGYELDLPKIREAKKAFLEDFNNNKKQKRYYAKGGKVYVKN